MIDENDETDMIEEELSAELDDEIASERDFAHSFLDVGLEKTLTCLARIMPGRLPAFSEIFSNQFAAKERHMLLAGKDSGTILWHHSDDLPVSIELSRQCGNQVYWISAYDQMRCWAFAAFHDGSTAVLVRDPERVWKENVFQGEEITGRGLRQFDTMDDFLGHVARWYKPVDKVWNSLYWTDPVRRQAKLKIRRPSITRCIDISIQRGRLRLEGIGEWEDGELNQLRKCLAQ